jgi:hypothetical protein
MTTQGQHSATNGRDHDGEATNVDSPPKLTRREEIAMKREAKKKLEEENLSFAPNLVSRKSLGVKAKPTTGETPDSQGNGEPQSAFSRLYSEARKKQEDAKKEGDTTKDKTLTFTPTITPRAASRERSKSPADLVRRQYLASGAGREIKEPEAPKDSFKPQISKRAKSLERNKEMSPNDRLYSQALIDKEKKERLREAVKREEDKNLTFAPMVGPKPPNAAAPTATKPLSERMQKYIEERNRKLEEARKEKEAKEIAEITLKPAIIKKDTKTTETKNVFDRLARADKHPKVEEEHPTFQPQIFTGHHKRASSVRARVSPTSNQLVIIS